MNEKETPETPETQEETAKVEEVKPQSFTEPPKVIDHKDLAIINTQNAKVTQAQQALGVLEYEQSKICSKISVLLNGVQDLIKVSLIKAGIPEDEITFYNLNLSTGELVRKDEAPSTQSQS